MLYPIIRKMKERLIKMKITKEITNDLTVVDILKTMVETESTEVTVKLELNDKPVALVCRLEADE